MIEVTDEMQQFFENELWDIEYNHPRWKHQRDRVIKRIIELHEANKPKPEQLNLDHYDAGLLGGSSLCDVSWWHNYLIVELERAHDYYQSQVDCLTQYTVSNANPLLRHNIEVYKMITDEQVIKAFADRVYRPKLSEFIMCDQPKRGIDI